MDKKITFSTMLNSLVSISSFNQGKAAKIISDLKDDDVKIIVKNNEPMAALLTVERFNELCEKENRLFELEMNKYE